jgi:hypothetical protein
MVMEDTWDIWDKSAATPFWGRIEQLEELSKLVSCCVQTVTESKSTREMVLETWLVLDYAVRDLIVSGYDLYRFCQEDFDLRYILLPRSFVGLLRLLQETASCQSSLPEEPCSPKRHDYPPYIRSSYGFFKYLMENHSEISERLKAIEAQYFAIRHPELAEQIGEGVQFFCAPKERGAERQRLPSGWLEVVRTLGDDWFSLARRLNRARNKAAHSHDPSAIAKAFGIAGPQTVEMVRAECLQLLRGLLGITLNATDPAKSAEAS